MQGEELWLEQKNHVSVEQVTDPCIPHFTKQLRSEKTPHFLQNSSELKIQPAIKKKIMGKFAITSRDKGLL